MREFAPIKTAFFDSDAKIRSEDGEPRDSDASSLNAPDRKGNVSRKSVDTSVNFETDCCCCCCCARKRDWKSDIT